MGRSPRSPQQTGSKAYRESLRPDATPEERSPHRWGIILAGGDGVRLRSLTRFICGDDRPKQFCPPLGEGTLLANAWERAERSMFHTL